MLHIGVIMNTEEARYLEKRIEKLEEWSHPPVAPGGTTELLELIGKLEKRIEKLENDRAN